MFALQPRALRELLVQRSLVTPEVAALPDRVQGDARQLLIQASLLLSGGRAAPRDRALPPYAAARALLDGAGVPDAAAHYEMCLVHENYCSSLGLQDAAALAETCALCDVLDGACLAAAPILALDCARRSRKAPSRILEYRGWDLQRRRSATLAHLLQTRRAGWSLRQLALEQYAYESKTTHGPRSSSTATSSELTLPFGPGARQCM
jgi:hypothetical protein